MISISENLTRPEQFRFRIAQALGPGEHLVKVTFPGPPVLLDISGLAYDDQDRPDAVIDNYHPDIEGIGWNDIWEAVRRQTPSASSKRAATDLEYQTIKASIAQFGSLQRVVLDESGNVIAGRLRKRACAELGVHCPTEVISGLSSEQKEQLAFELDFCRKQLTLDDKRRAAKVILTSNPRTTDRVIGRTCGLDHKTVGVIRDDLEQLGEIPQVEQRQGGDGKTYKFPKIVADTKKEEERAKTGLQFLGQDAPAKPLDLKQAEKLVRCKRAAARKTARSQSPTLLDDSIQIVHADFRSLQVEDESIPLIMTDPPYDQAGIPLWRDLATFAKRVLRPDGFLVTYTGTMFLPEVLSALAHELTFVWQIALIHEGGRELVWSRNVVNKYKPVLIFSKATARCPMLINDVQDGSGKEKEFHKWQQNIAEVMHFVEAFSQPGELVVDPFGGGFTTAAACHRIGRRCLTCDIDTEAVQRGLERLAMERRQKSL